MPLGLCWAQLLRAEPWAGTKCLQLHSLHAEHRRVWCGPLVCRERRGGLETGEVPEGRKKWRVARSGPFPAGPETPASTVLACVWPGAAATKPTGQTLNVTRGFETTASALAVPVTSQGEDPAGELKEEGAVGRC